MKKITITIPLETHKEFQKACIDLGKSMNQVLFEQIETIIRKEQNDMTEVITRMAEVYEDEGGRWGVEFAQLPGGQYVYRQYNPMIDEEWTIGDEEALIDLIKEVREDLMERGVEESELQNPAIE